MEMLKRWIIWGIAFVVFFLAFRDIGEFFNGVAS